jgi:predicted acyltransferase
VRGQTLEELTRKILLRGLILMGLGLVLTAYEQLEFAPLSLPFEHVRIPGILQRIALVYVCASLLVLYCSVRVQGAVTAGCLVLYWAAMTWVPVPGYGAGNLTPEGNLAAFVDRHLLPGHLGSGTWDGVGPFSTIPAIGTGFLGVLVCRYLFGSAVPAEVSAWLFGTGWLSILAGLVWNIWFPINKLLWTSSYVLFTAGAAMQLLGLCHWLIEVKNWRAWARPFIVLGMNPITAFAFSTLMYLALAKIKLHGRGGEISIRQWIYENVFLSWVSNPLSASLAFAVTYVLFWLGVLGVLYRLRIFIKV